MNAKRQVLLTALLASTVASPSHAGCLDWLFCKQPAQTPYAVGFAPQTTVTPVGPPTVIGSTVTPYAAGFAPVAGANFGQPANFGHTANFAGTLPAIALQAPPYGAAVSPWGVPIDNPSVLTGRPVMQTSAMQAMPMQTMPTQVMSMQATHMQSMPVQTMPMQSMPAQGDGGFMAQPQLPPAAFGPSPQAAASSSVFSRMFGNNYQTSYYDVPTTTYRPVTQVDPATGALVTVQQPCTSTTQQVQRSPYTAFQPAAPAQAPANPYYGEPACGSEPPRYAAPTNYGATSGYPAAGYAAPSGVSQATGAASPYGQAYGAQGSYNAPSSYAAPQATYATPQSTYATPNSQPLTGYPNPVGSNGTSSQDLAPINQPQLDAARPAWSTPSTQPTPSTQATPSYPSTQSYPSSNGSLEAPALPSTSAWPSTTAWPNRSGSPASDNVTMQRASSPEATRDKYSDIAPIPAPDDYRAPAWTELYNKPNATPVDSGRDSQWRETTPATRQPTSATLAEPRTANVDRAWSGRTGGEAAMHYASAPNQNAIQQPSEYLPPLPPAAAAPAPRSDAGWFPIKQP
jgi:hypothetical protein